MFIREFSVIDSATSVKLLKMRLKDNELEQYGKPFIPEFVYEVIRHQPRFSTMRVSRKPLPPLPPSPPPQKAVRRGVTVISFSVDTSKMRRSS